MRKFGRSTERKKGSKDLPLGKLDLSKMDMSITIKIRRRRGYYMATSRQVPGLVLSTSKWDDLFKDAPEVIRQLLRGNCGIEW